MTPFSGRAGFVDASIARKLDEPRPEFLAIGVYLTALTQGTPRSKSGTLDAAIELALTPHSRKFVYDKTFVILGCAGRVAAG